MGFYWVVVGRYALLCEFSEWWCVVMGYCGIFLDVIGLL